jgi:DNA-binding beta-propeller fold protein YncE
MHRIAVAATLLALAVNAWSAELPSCWKNHYILEGESCPPVATDIAIGAVGALAFDPSGVLHFSGPSVVFRLEAGALTRVAGSGRPGFDGDGGPAVNALLNFELSYPEVPFWWDIVPSFVGGIAFDGAGNLYIADGYNNRVRIVDPSGTIRTFVGGAMRRKDDVGLPIFSGYWYPQGLAVDSSGGVYVTGQFASLLRIPAEDAAIEQITDWPALDMAQNIAVDSAGDVYVAGNCSIKKVRRDGRVSLAVGAVQCDWLKPEMIFPYGVALDAQEDLFITDTYNNCVRKARGGKLTTIAGMCGREGGGYAGDGGPATQALLRAPRGIVVDREGIVYIADTGNNRVRMIDRDGIITTSAGNGESLPR